MRLNISYDFYMKDIFKDYPNVNFHICICNERYERACIRPPRGQVRRVALQECPSF